jgi:hypothetical protein
VILVATLLLLENSSANRNQKFSQVHSKHVPPTTRELADWEAHTGKYGEDSKLIVGGPASQLLLSGAWLGSD